MSGGTKSHSHLIVLPLNFVIVAAGDKIKLTRGQREHLCSGIFFCIFQVPNKIPEGVLSIIVHD
jgi:hypothetical protein